MRPDERQRTEKAALVALGLLAAALLAFQIFKVAVRPLVITDLRYVWLAGDFWASGLNPYGADYIPRSVATFGEPGRVSVWVYPFQWYWIARPLALLSPLAALRVWQVASFLLLAAGSVLTLRAATLLNARAGRLTIGLLAVYASSFTPLAGLVQLGQPVLLSVFGFTVLVYGMAAGRDGVKLAGVVLLALKPQFGIPILLLFATTPGGVRLCVIGGVLTAALAGPPLLISGVAGQIVGMIGNATAGYGDVLVNRPISMVGLPNLMALLAGVDLSVGAGLLVASVVALAIGLALRRTDRLTAVDKTTFVTAAAALVVSCLVGVHTYDLTVLLVPLPLLLRERGAPLWIGLAGYLLLWRVDQVGRLFGLDGLTETIALSSAAVLLIALGWVVSAATRMRAAA